MSREATASDEAWVRITDPADPAVEWRFERSFVSSNWECSWGRGCVGILDVPAEHLLQGCCSEGAQLADEVESMTVSASAAAVPVHLWQFADRVDDDDVFTDATRTALKVVEGACIFLNRPGFAGGVGCALHLAALELGERPIDWKPLVCWQAPVKASESTADDGTAVVTVRSWRRDDWGSGGATMAWCCTEPADRATFDSFTGDRLVVDSLQVELTELAGDAVWATLRAAVRGPSEGR
jgi:hypothetical protein